jgi:hypothetical protein
MLHRRASYFAVPAIAALLGAGVASQAAAQTVTTYPGQTQTTTQTTVTAPAQLAQSAIVVAPAAPPPPQVEAAPPPPATATVTTYWQPGHWNWNGASWVWIDGAYMQRVQQPTATAVWVPGQWVQQTTGGYVWVAGHWQT